MKVEGMNDEESTVASVLRHNIDLAREVLSLTKERDEWKNKAFWNDSKLRAFETTSVSEDTHRRLMHERDSLKLENEKLRKAGHDLANLAREASEFLMVKEVDGITPRNIFQEFQDMRKERDEAKEQTTQMRLACEDYPKMVDKLLKERDELKAWMRANLQEMECRQDDDCDHCVGLILVGDT